MQSDTKAAWNCYCNTNFSRIFDVVAVVTIRQWFAAIPLISEMC